MSFENSCLSAMPNEIHRTEAFYLSEQFHSLVHVQRGVRTPKLQAAMCELIIGTSKICLSHRFEDDCGRGRPSCTYVLDIFHGKHLGNLLLL